MSLICVFDSSYHIEVNDDLKDELQKLLYCKHIKNVIVDYAVDTTSHDNPIQEVSTSEMKNTMYIFPSVINEAEQVDKIKQYLMDQDETDPKTPIMLFISSSKDAVITLLNRYGLMEKDQQYNVNKKKKHLIICCHVDNLIKLVKLLQTMYFGGERYVNTISADKDTAYFNILKDKLNIKYGKILRELPKGDENTQPKPKYTVVQGPDYPPILQPPSFGPQIPTVSGPTHIVNNGKTLRRTSSVGGAGTSTSFNMVISSSDIPNELESGTIIIPDLSPDNPNFANYLIDFFLIEADKSPDFKGMETGEMPPKQEFHAQAYKLMAKYGVKEIKDAEYKAITELESQRNNALKKIKEYNDEIAILDKLYKSDTQRQTVLKFIESIEIKRKKKELVNDDAVSNEVKKYIQENFHPKECEYYGEEKYKEFIAKNYNTLLDISKYKDLEAINKKTNELNCYNTQSMGYNFISLLIIYQLKYQWWNKLKTEQINTVKNLDVQIRKLKGKNPKTAEQQGTNTANTTIHYQVKDKLAKSTTLRKATNQISAIKYRLNELEKKHKECHKEKKTSHHWKYTIKRDKEYREACKLQEKLEELEKYKSSQPSINPLILAGFEGPNSTNA